jgi:Histidine kinase
LNRRGVPEEAGRNGGALRSNGPADVEGVRRVAQQMANGNGHRPATGDPREVHPGLVDFGGLALTSRRETARRLLAASDAERDRIGKDLHDGAQQRLTALRIRLALAAEDFEARGDEDAGGMLNQFGEEVEEAIDELRELVHGVYPVLLTSGGLSPALASAGRRGSAGHGASERRWPLPTRYRDRRLLRLSCRNGQRRQARRALGGDRPGLGASGRSVLHGPRRRPRL